MSIITVERKVLEKNDQVAAENRSLLKRYGIRTLNVISSPGSGKTTLLERTLERLAGRLGTAVIEGDVQTDLDARRLERFAVPVAQIVTRGGCHLEAALVRDALEQLDLRAVRLLVIENVGNLVCPAGFDLGEDDKVVVVSTTEGDDKPLKYPKVFRNASLLVINKTDLLPYVDSSPEVLAANAREINPEIEVLALSARTGAGLDGFCAWLEGRVAESGP